MQARTGYRAGPILFIGGCLILAMFVMCAKARAQTAAEPVRTPFLMIDAEMHVGPVTSVAVDAAASIVATGSVDRTIRLFDAADGRFLRKVVLPLGDGPIGTVSGLAMSADGKQLLAGTVSFDTGTDFDMGSLYLIDTMSGDLLGRIKPLAGAPSAVKFSPDGSRMALSFGQLGFELRTAKGKRLFQELKEPIAALAIDDAQVVTISDQAEVRIYGSAGDTVELQRNFTLDGAGQPNSIALTPDGHRLAVGYLDRSFVDVVDLQGRKKPTRLTPPNGLADGNLAVVTWTRGKEPVLVAGGKLQTLGLENVLVGWQNGEAKRAIPPLVVGTDAVSALAPAGTDGVVFATADPAWGRAELGADLKLHILTRRQGERLDFRELPARGFEISRDGTGVVFSGRSPDQLPLRFDMASLELTEDPLLAPDLVEPNTAKVTSLLGAWTYSTTPSLKGRRLELERDERALSADVAADGTRLVLGTDYRLRLFDAKGQEQGSRRLTAAAWAVAMVPSRPLLVAALGDGSVRWYSLREDSFLAEIAGLFVTPDGRRWVAWTGDGLFAHADQGGAKLVGYQQNGTTKAPTGTWLPFDQAYRLFYDPDAVRSVLGDEASWPTIAQGQRVAALFEDLALPRLALEAYCPLDQMPSDVATRGLKRVSAAGAAKTPTQLADGCIDLTAPGGGGGLTRTVTIPATTEAIRLRVGITAGNRGLASVDALVGGRNTGRVELPASAAQAPLTAGQTVTVERVVPLADLETTLVFRAYDGAGLAAQSAPLLVRRDGLPPPRPRTLHVLAVGVDAYGGEWPQLKFAVADARTFADIIEASRPAAYARIDVQHLENADATREGLSAALTRLARTVQVNDALLIYLAGHGIANDDGAYTYVTSNATTEAGIADQGLNGADLLRQIAEIPARNRFLFLDTCYSGAFNMKGSDKLAHEGGFLVLTAASSLQPALDSYDGRNGTLAFAIREKLAEGAARSGPPVDALELGLFARSEVGRLAADRKWQQNASFKTSGGDLEEFPIAEIRAIGQTAGQ